MSKKTNAEKQARRSRPRAHKRHPRGRLNPIPAEWRLPIDGTAGSVPPAVAASLVDLALGQGFVQFLRAIGVRDKITEIVFNADDGDAAEGSD